MKKYLSIIKSSTWYIISFVVVTLLLSLLYYFTNISLNFISTALLLYVGSIFFIIGYKGGKKCESKGFVYGLKYGFGGVLIMYLLGGILFTFKLNLYKIIYYLILILVCVLGSMLGINKKK